MQCFPCQGDGKNCLSILTFLGPAGGTTLRTGAAQGLHFKSRLEMEKSRSGLSSGLHTARAVAVSNNSKKWPGVLESWKLQYTLLGLLGSMSLAGGAPPWIVPVDPCTPPDELRTNFALYQLPKNTTR